MKRGEIYWAKLAPRSGSEQRGRRPVVVVSHDSFNQVPAWRSVVVVPVSTSAAQTRRGPTAIDLPAGSGGLARQSVVLCHQVTTLDRQKLHQAIGTLAPALLARVNAGLRVALDLEDEGGDNPIDPAGGRE
jgi:mRNA interferase MazF